MSAFLIYASIFAFHVIRSWDLSSGSERQILMERKTYLVSTVVSHITGVEILSLLLFVILAERMHPLFTGAMCAAGTLNANAYGYPTLVLKIINSIAAGVWLIVNHTDQKAHDYPLIRHKYRLLMGFTASFLLENMFQFSYFAGLHPNIITSCCGILFSAQTTGLSEDLFYLSPLRAQIAFYVLFFLTVRVGMHFLRTGRPARLFSLLAAVLFIFSLFSVISFISVLYYELPSHHCPFCLLQGEYGYVGFPLYAFLFLAGIAGLGMGVLDRHRRIPSLVDVIPATQRRLALAAMIGFTLFALMATYPVISSDFRLYGY